MALDTRTQTGGRFMVTVDGVAASFVKSVDGFNQEADIVSNDMGPQLFQSKHVANFKHTPGKFSIGAGMGRGFWNWIKAALEKGYVRKNGSIVSGDFDYNARTEVTWQDGLITSIGFPKLDAAGKDAIYLEVEVDAEAVRVAPASGKINGQYGTKQKAWLAPNFRLDIAGLPCERVSTIDAMTWKCSVSTDHTGIHREHAKVPAKVTYPDMKFTVSANDFKPWSEAAKKWFVDGEHLENNHMQGSITLLAPDMKNTVARIELHNLGFKAFKRGKLEANSEKADRMEIEMYMEGMTFSEYVADA